MDFLDELESMAMAVGDISEISELDLRRWQDLFGMSDSEAQAEIERFRDDLGRRRLPDHLWNDTHLQKEAEGHNRESYEYSLTLHKYRPQSSISNSNKAAAGSGSFIVQLDGPLTDASTVQRILGLREKPYMVTGRGTVGDAMFCEIDAQARQKLLDWLASHDHGSSKPTIIRLAKAKKDLGRYNHGPVLGRDMTLPQYRAVSEGFISRPEQTEYPVWYFFYGTLANAGVLSAQLDLPGDEEPSFVPASIRGGQIRTWARKYKALVDDFDSTKQVLGSAYNVTCKEREDALRFYETDKYEVVRCTIETATGTIPGLTFRFAGAESELDCI